MQHGTRDEFEYAECASCGTLELLDAPDDLAKYYPPNYYSFAATASNPRRARVESAVCLVLAVSHGLAWPLVRTVAARQYRAHQTLRERLHAVRSLAAAGVRRSSAILDVGCGNGRLLESLDQAGFTRLTGIDPFIQGTTSVGRVQLRRETIYQHEGQYHAIVLNHSFEHMPSPALAMRRLRDLLLPGGKLVIRIPIADSYAFRTYRADWYQLDAPRHLFLHTRAGMRLLADQAGLTLSSVWTDGSDWQFWASELYRRGVPLVQAKPGEFFSSEEAASFWRRSQQLNRSGDGDQAVFLFKPNHR